MPFGNSGAPAAFDGITQALVRLMKAEGHTAFVGYLDDCWLLERDLRSQDDRRTLKFVYFVYTRY
jgi:hypothetical protein